jgi:plastocyanin
MKQHTINAVVTGFSTAQTTVDVGASGFVFSPDTVTANAGDVIEFVISSGHTVAQSSFDNPCQPISSSAIYSGFPSNGAIFSVTVNSSDTLWFYCSVQGHCQGGMAMVVNPP